MEIECLRLDFHVYDMAIRCQRMQVEALGNRVLETRFPIWLFQILKSPCLLSYSHSHPHPLTLKPKHSHSHTNRPTLTVSASPTPPSLVLSLSQPHRRRCRSSSHSLSPTPTPSHSHTNQSTHTVSASFKRSEFWLVITELWSPSVCAVSKNQKEKGESFYSKCKMQSVFHCVYAEKQWEKWKNLLWKFVFFFFLNFQ